MKTYKYMYLYRGLMDTRYWGRKTTYKDKYGLIFGRETDVWTDKCDGLCMCWEGGGPRDFPDVRSGMAGGEAEGILDKSIGIKERSVKRKGFTEGGDPWTESWKTSDVLLVNRREKARKNVWTSLPGLDINTAIIYVQVSWGKLWVFCLSTSHCF